jgi:pimeloyl-ACP methyl ester carboxylesterase
MTTDPRLSRRSLLRVMTTAGILAAASHGVAQAHQLAATPGATPWPADGLAGTPMGDQVAWLIAAMNEGGASLTEADITEHVAPPFLAVIPPPQLIGLVQQLAEAFGTVELAGVTRPPTETQAVGLVMSGAGLQIALPISVEAASPHRITGLNVYPMPPIAGDPAFPVASDGAGLAMSSDLIDVDGRRLYVSETGEGSPTVVLEGGLGDSAATWSGIIPAIASFTRVVSYDRSNTNAGASDPAPTPRAAADVVSDLHALLDAAAVPGPYVLVGHSIGGIFVRLYASQYPDEVSGLVLIDASHEAQTERRRDVVTPEQFAQAEQMIQASNIEGIDLDASFAQMQEATSLRPMPLAVLTAGQFDTTSFPEGWPVEAEVQIHSELQEDLAALVPGARHIIAEQSAHYIQQAEPDLVVDAIRQVADAVRDPASWATPTTATPAP